MIGFGGIPLNCLPFFNLIPFNLSQRESSREREKSEQANVKTEEETPWTIAHATDVVSANYSLAVSDHGRNL